MTIINKFMDAVKQITIPQQVIPESTLELKGYDLTIRFRPAGVASTVHFSLLADDGTNDSIDMEQQELSAAALSAIKTLATEILKAKTKKEKSLQS